MSRIRHTEVQMIVALKQMEVGRTAGRRKCGNDLHMEGESLAV